MKKEIIKWYSDNHYHPEKVVKIGRKRFSLSEAQILTAMEHCYHKVQAGKNVPIIDMARYVFNVATDINAEEYEKRLELLKNNESIIKDTKLQILSLQNEVIHKEKDTKYLLFSGWIFGFILNLLFWVFILNLG